MNYFHGNGFYVRSPDADDSDFKRIKLLGFDALAINVRDHSLEEWQTLITRAATAELAVFPWGRTETKVEVVSLCRLAATMPHRHAIVNAENELVDGRVTAEYIASQLRENQLTGCVSTLAWTGTPPCDLEPLGNTPVHLQLFPSVSDASTRPRDCRAHAYADAGAGFVSFMTGVTDAGKRADPRDFPPRQHPVWVYTLDDVQHELDSWAPIGRVLLSELTVPFTGPYYGPSHPKYGKRPKRSKTAKALKMILHEAGLENFGAIDTMYGAKLERAMRRLQVLFGLQPTGAYGRGSWLAIRELASANVGGTFACTHEAATLIKEDVK